MKTTLHPAEVAKKAFSATGGSGVTPTAAQISYNNTESGLTANKVQGALDEVAEATSSIDKSLLAGSAHFYFDEKDGVFGYNTDEERGADTFHPFNSGSKTAVGVSDYQTSGIISTDLGFKAKYLAVISFSDEAGITPVNAWVYDENFSTTQFIQCTSSSGLQKRTIPYNDNGLQNITDTGFTFKFASTHKKFRYFAIG